MFKDWKTQSNKDVNSYKLTYRFNTIPIKISTRFLIDIEKLILKFTWKGEKP